MPLVFGHYAWLTEWQREAVLEAGSGIFVAPGIGLGAKHVSRGFEKLDDRIEAAQRRTSVFADQYAPLPTVTQYAGLLFQAPNIRMPSQEDIPYWSGVVDWHSPDTDITTLHAEPITAASKKAANDGMAFLNWQLLPPDRGAEVDIFGFPGVKITVDSGFHIQDVRLCSETVRVVEVFDVLQVHGFTGFPGFQVDRELAHGFSGGPVLYKGKLVGIFSGPDYVSALWPLLLHDYPDRSDNLDISLNDGGRIAKPLVMRQFADLFETGAIRALDYPAVAGRIRRVPCVEALASSTIDSRCDKRHITLMR